MTGLEGPYQLQRDTVDQWVSRASPGTYAMGESDPEGFHIRYIGRSDSDVAVRIRELVGFYPEFQFAYFNTANAAFEKECQLFHEFGKSLDTRLHPSRSAYSNWRCPYCGLFDYY